MVALVLDPTNPLVPDLAFAYAVSDGEWIDSVSGVAATVSNDVTFAATVSGFAALTRVEASSIDHGFLPNFDSDTKTVSTYLLTNHSDNLGTFYAQRTDAEARSQLAVSGDDLVYLLGASGVLTLDNVNNYADGVDRGVGLTLTNTTAQAYRDGVAVGTPADITAETPVATQIQMATGNRWSVYPTVSFGANNANFAFFFGWNRTLTPAEMASIHADPAQIFADTVLVGNTLELQNSIEAFAGNTVEIQNSIEAFAGNTLELQNSIQVFVDNTLELQNSIEAFAGNTLELQNSIQVFVGNILDIRNAVAESAGNTLDIRNQLVAFAGNTLDIRYQSSNFTGNTLDIRYQIDPSALSDLVGRSLDIRYGIGQIVGLSDPVSVGAADATTSVASLDGVVTVSSPPADTSIRPLDT